MSTGPITDPPPTGPGRRTAAYAAASTAGSYGRSASPMSSDARVDNYWKQNGTKRLTPAQRRRAVKKARGEAVRLLASAGFAARVWK